MTQSTQELLQLALSELGAAPPPPTERVRTFVQGATSGFGEEIEAAVRAAVPGQPGYEQIRDDLRQRLRAYKEANPTESLLIEGTGAAAPVVLAMLGGPAAAGATARTTFGRVTRGVGAGAAEGALAGAGYSEASEPVGVLRDVGTGAATGAVVSPVMGLATRGLGLTADAFVQRARQMMGDLPATAVQAELLRLANDTGKTVDEIINDVASGRIMADNRTLRYALRAYRSKGGPTASYIEDTLERRAAALKENAETAAQEALTPGTTGNVYAARQLDDKALRALENEEYGRVFSAHPELDVGTTQQLEQILQRFPDARAEMDKIYRNTDRLVPLYTTDPNGAVRMTRMPSLEDAEIVRRALDEAASKAYREGSGTLGESYADTARALRGRLDTEYGDLNAVRTLAAQRRTARDLFDAGRKVFNIPPDQLEYEFQAIAQDPVKLRAFRAGVMDALRTKLRANSVQLAAMADPERRFGAILQTVFPEDSGEQVMARLARAGESAEVRNTVRGGSATEPERAASARIGTAPSAEQILRALNGDPLAGLQVLRKTMSSRLPNLTEQQRREIVDVLFSEDPELVRRALTDDTAAARLWERASKYAAALAAGGQRATVQTSARGVTEREDTQ